MGEGSRRVREHQVSRGTIESRGLSYAVAEFVPRADPPAGGWPVVLFLHGMGESGSAHESLRVGLPAVVARNPPDWPCVMVVPQKPVHFDWWGVHLHAALAALDRAMRTHPCNARKVALTGLSQGGNACWELVRGEPGRWSCVAPVCGFVDPPKVEDDGSLRGRWSWPDPGARARETAAALGETACWIFHGSADPVIPVEQSRAMAEAIGASGGSVRLSVYEGVGHDAWIRAYDEPEIARWLLGHEREA